MKEVKQGAWASPPARRARAAYRPPLDAMSHAQSTNQNYSGHTAATAEQAAVQMQHSQLQQRLLMQWQAQVRLLQLARRLLLQGQPQQQQQQQ